MAGPFGILAPTFYLFLYQTMPIYLGVYLKQNARELKVPICSR